MDIQQGKQVVSICETQPITFKGLRHLLDETDDLVLGDSHNSPAEWMMSGSAESTDLLIIDKGLGAHLVLEALNRLPTVRKGADFHPAGRRGLGAVDHRSRGLALPAVGRPRNRAEIRRLRLVVSLLTSGGGREKLDAGFGLPGGLAE